MSDAAQEWVSQFPGLSSLPDSDRTRLIGSGQVITLRRGACIYGPGQAPTAYLLLLEGTIRVQQVSATGRDIVLYRVAAGESCALTTACLMGYEDFPAEAIAETDVKAVAIPRVVFDDLIASSSTFRRFVFTAFSSRFTKLLQVIDEIAFGRMDLRLAQKLIELADGGDVIAATQQQLATELGTAREVVSRVLSDFQRRGWVQSARGSVSILDRPALTRFAEGG